METRNLEREAVLQNLRIFILSVALLFTCCKSFSQWGFIEKECGIDSSTPYEYFNYSLPHYDYYRLYHGNTLIASQGQDYGPAYRGEILKCINDNWGIFISYCESGHFFDVFKLNGDYVNVLGAQLGPPFYYELFIVNEHTAYFFCGDGYYIYIYKFTDYLPLKILINSAPTGTIVHDTIPGTPLCPGLSELNFCTHSSGDSLKYKIIIHSSDSLNSCQNINVPECRMYPNPVISDLFIEMNEAGHLEIMNIHGQLIENHNLTKKTNKLDLADLPVGVYLLRIKTQNGIATRKLIKQ